MSNIASIKDKRKNKRRNSPMFLSSQLREQIIVILSFGIIGIVGGLVGYYNQTEKYKGELLINNVNSSSEFKEFYDQLIFVAKIKFTINYEKELYKDCQNNDLQAFVIETDNNKSTIVKLEHKDKKIISTCFNYIDEKIKKLWLNETKNYIEIKKAQKNRIDDIVKQGSTNLKYLNTHNYAYDKEILIQKSKLIAYEIDSLTSYSAIMPFQYQIKQIQKKSIKIFVILGFFLGLAMGILFWQSKVLSFNRDHLKR